MGALRKELLAGWKTCLLEHWQGTNFITKLALMIIPAGSGKIGALYASYREWGGAGS